jgi:crossover junction endodeoxyribonuclease RusA
MISVFVAGLPVPQGSMKPVTLPGRKYSVLVSANKNLKPWRKTVAETWAVRQGAESKRIHRPDAVLVKLAFWFPRSAGHFTKRGRLKASAPTHFTVRPDVDKLERAILDALTIAGAYDDDAQVVAVIKQKRYVTDFQRTPGVRISLEANPILDDGAQ